MCWGVPAVVRELLGEFVEIDYGDGVLRRVIIGISEEKLKKGDLVLVHAGVVISKLSYEDASTTAEMLRDIARTAGEGSELLEHYEKILKLSKEVVDNEVR
ncbi:MAG: HypC/HybG/HupF family hydrogenase formation chaperone [Archaeoglobaceae archaeon]|nr:HypC/HybG/HupF family hydrogenase formation chaperone [Archaeoglobaceae archaeon]MDW8117542.1 HypC/HybG/HupF family hydrogenase formation chaperone [Archaeoglobaceae archaeon]